MNLYGPKQLADSVRTVRKNTILIAEDTPEKDYGYRPTVASRSVAETLTHIALLSLQASVCFYREFQEWNHSLLFLSCYHSPVILVA